MKGFIGCDADLVPGAEIITGHNLELRMVVLRAATEAEAQESADRLGHALVITPGERFYEVEVSTAPVGGNN